MKSIKERCIDLLKNEDIRKDMREIIRPISEIIYNEIYVYIWFICFYNVVLLVLFIINLYFLFRIMFSIDQTKNARYFLI